MATSLYPRPLARHGSVLGSKYELLMPIAEGGMGSVWAARALGARGFETVVAVKMLLPDLQNDASTLAMFLTEARIASKICHPNVVRVMDLGEHDHQLYQVMDLVDGEPLSSVLQELRNRGQRLPLSVIVDIIGQACLGLHAAHELTGSDGALLEVIHRDVSPQNILLAMDGRVLVSDFGIAHCKQRGGDRTGPGLIKGKISYLAPEQALGTALDKRVDVFALGTVLYSLLTGTHPFRGDNELATLQRLISGQAVPPSALMPDGHPGDMDVVVLKAIATAPAERFASMIEFRRALRRAVGQNSVDSERTELPRLLEELVGARVARRRDMLQTLLLEEKPFVLDLETSRDPPRAHSEQDVTVAELFLVRPMAVVQPFDSRPAPSAASVGPMETSAVVLPKVGDFPPLLAPQPSSQPARSWSLMVMCVLLLLAFVIVPISRQRLQSFDDPIAFVWGWLQPLLATWGGAFTDVPSVPASSDLPPSPAQSGRWTSEGGGPAGASSAGTFFKKHAPKERTF